MSMMTSADIDPSFAKDGSWPYPLHPYTDSHPGAAYPFSYQGRASVNHKEHYVFAGSICCRVTSKVLVLPAIMLFASI